MICGEDHVTNSAAQIQIFRAPDAPVPAFDHLPLLVDAQGGGLSSRTGSLSIVDLRERDERWRRKTLPSARICTKRAGRINY